MTTQNEYSGNNVAESASDEPMYLISESELARYHNLVRGMNPDNLEKLTNAIRSRPAPAQQQAPANPCIGNDCIDIENCDEICKHQRVYSPAWLAQHDAGIATKARKEGYAEGVKDTLDKHGILYGDDAKQFHNYINSKEPVDTPEGQKLIAEAKAICQQERKALQDRDRLMLEKGAAFERERVLKEIIEEMESYTSHCPDAESERRFCKSIVKVKMVKIMAEPDPTLGSIP